MKQIILIVAVLAISQNIPVMAEEGVMCSFYFPNVKRKVELIKEHGQDLSQMAKGKLISDLKFETGECISTCEGEKFKFCNVIAKWIPEAEASLRVTK
jgi:hypothetical protein